MKRIAIFAASLLAGAAMFGVVVKLIGFQPILDSLSQVTLQGVLSIFFLTVLIALFGNWKWRAILTVQGVRVGFFELFRIYLAGYFLMFIFPMILWAGEIFRGYAVRQKNQAAFPKGLASVIIDRITEWTANLAVISFGAAIFLGAVGIPERKLTFALAGLILTMVLGLAYFYVKLYRGQSIAVAALASINLKRLNEIDAVREVDNEIFHFFAARKADLAAIAALSAARAGLMALRAWLLLLLLGKQVAVSVAVSVLGFSYLSTMAPIPVALGIHEAALAFAFRYWEFGASRAAAFAFVIRSGELVLAFVGLLFLYQLGIRWFIKYLESAGKIDLGQ